MEKFYEIWTVKELGAEVTVLRNDAFQLEELEKFDKIILSPLPVSVLATLLAQSPHQTAAEFPLSPKLHARAGDDNHIAHEYDGIQLNSGTHFPNRVPSGNCIPDSISSSCKSSSPYSEATLTHASIFSRLQYSASRRPSVVPPNIHILHIAVSPRCHQTSI